MAKKKKNSNYVTEKTTAAKAAKAVAEKKKKTKQIIVTSLSVFLVVAIIVGAVFAIGIPFGMLDYKPEATEESHVTVDNYGEIRVGFYTNDAPKSIEAFEKLITDGYFSNKSFDSLEDGLLYFGGDLNNVEFDESEADNNISVRKGTIAFIKGEDGKTRLFIATKNATKLNGECVVIAKITSGMDVVKSIANDADENGKIPATATIKSVSSPHAPH